MGSFLNLAGKKFGRLTAIEPKGLRGDGHAVKWFCICDCGGQKVVCGKKLRKGNTVSCGCYRRERTSERYKTHAACSGNNRKWTPEYRAWVSMKSRCNPDYDHPDFKNYAARGIKVCEYWKNSFARFLADVGPRPSDKHSLDRYPNNDGNYELGNVRWATRREQMLNTRISIAKRQREAA